MKCGQHGHSGACVSSSWRQVTAPLVGGLSNYGVGAARSVDANHFQPKLPAIELVARLISIMLAELPPLGLPLSWDAVTERYPTFVVNFTATLE